MPHFVLECSESILSLTDPDLLMKAVYFAAESTDLFARNGVGGIKVRLNPYKYFINVDAHKHFIHIFANIMEGRTIEQKRKLSEKVVRAIKTLLPMVEIISMNVQDFEKATYCNAPMIQIGDVAGRNDLR
jgi:5-carboxymethyl-2-hydroxymuconate isomerase